MDESNKLFNEGQSQCSFTDWGVPSDCFEGGFSGGDSQLSDSKRRRGQGKPPKYPANFIQYWRLRRGLKRQEDLARLVGTTEQTIGNLEGGRRELTLGWMERIAPALQVLPSELIETEKGFRPVEVVALAGMWLHNPELPLDNRVRIQIDVRKVASGMAELHAYEVKSNHVNRELPLGGTVFAAKITPRHKLMDRRFYVLREQRDTEFRITIRECRRDTDGECWFWFASTEPEFQTPVRREAMATLSMEILGIVVAWTRYEETLAEGEL